jgi:outer membrane protein OmpU
MNNSTRNLKMKKLLIATTALVATAGMASADITITGHAAAGIHSGLDAAAAVAGIQPTTSQDSAASTETAAGVVTAGAVTAMVVGTHASDDAEKQAARDEIEAAEVAVASAATVTAAEDARARLADAIANAAVILGSAASNSGDGVYSNAGVDFTMTGATDNGISFSASVNIDAGTEIDTGDFELDGADGGTAGLGAVSMTGTFGTLTFDDGGIDNLYDDDLASADVSYSTTVGAVSLTLAHDTAGTAASNSLKAGYSASGMAFTLTASEAAGAGTSAKLAVAYALNDSVSLTGSSKAPAAGESVQTIGATTTLNGVSVTVSSANNSTWDVDLGYTAGGFALTYGVDETDAWTATATSALGGGATFAAGVSSDDEMYAGVSFAF